MAEWDVVGTEPLPKPANDPWSVVQTTPAAPAKPSAAEPQSTSPNGFWNVVQQVAKPALDISPVAKVAVEGAKHFIPGVIDAAKQPGEIMASDQMQTSEGLIKPAFDLASLFGLKAGKSMAAPPGEPVGRAPVKPAVDVAAPLEAPTKAPEAPSPTPDAAPSPGGQSTVPPIPEGVQPGMTPRTPPAGVTPEGRPTPDFITEQSDELFRLRQSVTADKQEIAQHLEQSPPEFKSPALQEKLYSHIEDPKGNPLSPPEKALFDQYLAPMQKELNDLYIKAKGYQVPEGDLIDPNYVHRVVKGHEPTAVPGEGGAAADPIMGTRSLPRTTSALQDRTMFAIENGNGTRKVVSIKDGNMAVHENGKATPLTDVDAEGLKPGDPVEIGGKPWEIKQATTKEIEGNTDVRYQKSAAVNMADALVRMRGVVRNVEYLEKLKSTPEWRQIASGPGEQAPAGWRTTKLPQLSGWKMDPKIANVFDDFYRPGLGEAASLEALRKVNRFAVGTMFWQPTPHIENVATHWYVGRGWDNFTPQGLRSLTTDGAQAIRQTITQGKLTQDMLREGSSLIHGGVANKDFYLQMAKRFGLDVQKNPERWGKVIKNLGLNTPADLVAAWYNGMNRVLWAANDMFMMQRTLELERKGMPRREAIREAEKHIPNYRVPPEVMGSRAMSELMQDPAVTAFGRYHYGIFNSYTNMVRDMLKGSTKDKVNAAGNMMALASLAFVIYPFVLDPAIRALTGNPKDKKLRRGPLSFPSQLYEAFHGDRTPYDVLANIITIAPALKEGAQQFMNRDFYTGQNINEPNNWRRLFSGEPKAAGNIATQIGEHAAGSMVQPYNVVNQAWKNSPDRTLGDMIRNQTLGIKDATPRSERSKLLSQKYDVLNDKKRHARPRGIIEKYGGPQ